LSFKTDNPKKSAMKKILLTLVAGINICISMANPIYMPEIYLGGLSFDENQDWKMKLSIWGETDSLIICSSTERSIFKIPADIIYTYELILTKDSLNPTVNINPKGDSITIISYLPHNNYRPDSLVETVEFGDYPGANIPKPQKSQSITRILKSIMRTNYHSIQDSSGNCYGTVHGRIFDKSNKLITCGSLNIDPFPLDPRHVYFGNERIGTDINIDGSYSVNLYSQIYEINIIIPCSKKVAPNNDNYYIPTDTVAINPLNFTMFPDSTIEMDIHLLDDYVGIENIQINSPDLLKAYPNPLINNELNYEISVPVRSTNCFIQLYNATGQIIWHQNIKDNRGLLTIPSYISNGTYILQFWMNGKAYQSKQLIINRK